MKNWDDFKKSLTSIPEHEIREIELKAYLVSKLIERRRELGLSQHQLAELCGMKQAAIGRIESGNGSIPKIETLQNIAKNLGMKLLIDLVKDEQAATQERGLSLSSFQRPLAVGTVGIAVEC